MEIGFVEQRLLADHVGLAALAPFRADIVRRRIAPAIRAEIGLGLDVGAWVGDHVDDALVERLRRDGLRQKFGDAGVAGRGDPLLLGVAGHHDDRHERIGVGAGLPDHLGQFETVEDRHRPVGHHDVGDVMGEGVEAGGAVLGLVDVARAEAVQQRAHDAPHVGIVIDDEETQAVEVDADHGAPGGRELPSPQRCESTGGSVKERFRMTGLRGRRGPCAALPTAKSGHNSRR